jgi:nitroimidazol reductase NimA-like FMN-containing flavoprotein (pyridoxamine 5'-phosphate oxidase superfamily)
MDPVKIPKLSKKEYDDLIKRQYVSRIAFIGPEHPYIAPFMYVFDGNHLYFLSTRYGRKMEYMKVNSRVSVEIEEYSPDMSVFRFVSLQGFLEEVGHPELTWKVKEMFVHMIQNHRLSPHVLTALGYTAMDEPSVITREDRCAVWKLTGVTDIVALKNG